MENVFNSPDFHHSQVNAYRMNFNQLNSTWTRTKYTKMEVDIWYICKYMWVVLLVINSMPFLRELIFTLCILHKRSIGLRVWSSTISNYSHFQISIKSNYGQETVLVYVNWFQSTNFLMAVCCHKHSKIEDKICGEFFQLFEQKLGLSRLRWIYTGS